MINKQKLKAAILSIIACLTSFGITAEAEMASNSDALSLPNIQLPQRMKAWPVTTEDGGGTLLFSDSPEYVSEDGIMYSDTVEGPGRVFYYHLNNTKKNKKIAVMVENQQQATAIVSITRGALGHPSDNYLAVGKEAQINFFNSKGEDELIVFGGHSKLLSEAMDRTIVYPDQLINGIYEFSSNIPVKLTVFMYPADADPYKFIKTAKQMPRDDVALRGTFKGMNRRLVGEKVYNPEKDGTVFLYLADDGSDKYLEGIDVTDDKKSINYGNYGILYELQLPTEGKGNISYFFSPMGGVYAGAIGIRANPNGVLDKYISNDVRQYGVSQPAVSQAENSTKGFFGRPDTQKDTQTAARKSTRIVDRGHEKTVADKRDGFRNISTVDKKYGDNVISPNHDINRVMSKGEFVLISTTTGKLHYGEKTVIQGIGFEDKKKPGISWLTAGNELSYLGSFPAGTELKFYFSPPGASNLPVYFILMPESKIKS